MSRLPPRSLAKILTVLILGVFVTGCDSDLFSESAKPPLPGKRISILSRDKELQPEATSGGKIKLPPPEPNDEWPQAGGSSNHAMHHMQIGNRLAEIWSTRTGEGASDRSKLLAQPIVALGRVYTVDAENQVTAISAKTGKKLWRAELTPDDVTTLSSGALAYDEGRLFVTTGFGQLITLDAKSGKVLWRQVLSGPVRGAAAVRAGRVITTTVDDHTYCIAADDGQILWTHQGTIEPASMLAGNSPAIDGNVVVVPYTSGELFALRIENGSVIWQDTIANVSRTQGVANLSDITGRPIVDRGRVYVIGHADVITAIDLRTGKRLWERDIGGIQSPWIAGDYLFVITNGNEIIAMDTKSGNLAWVTQLQTWQDPAKRKDRIVWVGPVLASNRLIIASSTGMLASISPYTGDILGQVELGDSVSVPPVIAKETLYFFTDEAEVVAYK